MTQVQSIIYGLCTKQLKYAFLFGPTPEVSKLFSLCFHQETASKVIVEIDIPLAFNPCKLILISVFTYTSFCKCFKVKVINLQ